VFRRGSALLAVLWLSAALAAIAFSAAMTVRAELEKTANLMEGTQAEFLARSAAQRALFYMLTGQNARLPDGRPRFWAPGIPLIRMSFPTGEALVEIVPESSKINLNTADPDLLMRLLVSVGANPMQAERITAAIVEWRTPAGLADSGMNAGLESTFRIPHASFQQIEELLAVDGMTPELFYGAIDRGPDGKWIPRAGLRECLTVSKDSGSFDINTVQPAVMAALGVPPDTIAALMDSRRHGPIVPDQMNEIAMMLGPAAGTFRIGGSPSCLIRATARVRRPDGRLSDLRRSASLMAAPDDQGGLGIQQVVESRSGPGVRPMVEAWAW
jgi:general secretion pathway protein K